MTTTWNAAIPALGNQISADIPDIQENFLLLNDILEAITTGTMGTTAHTAFTVDVLANGAYIPDTGTLGSATTVDAITIAANGDLTIKEDIVMGDGKTIGQAAGPLIAFDDTLNYLEITGCNVGIGTTTPKGDLQIGDASIFQDLNTGATAYLSYGRNVYYDGANYLRSVADNPSLSIQLDASGGFHLYTQTDAGATAGSTITFADRFTILNNGKIGIGTITPGALLEIQAAAGSPGALRLTTAELTVVDGDILGRMDFLAPLESSGTDAILVAASIWAEADAEFTASVNDTDLVFATGLSETAAEKMRLSSSGVLTLAGNIVIPDAGTIGSASAATAIAIASTGIVTFVDDILIKDAGTIGSASATTAIGIASTGIVTFVDDIIIKDSGTIGEASDTDLITLTANTVTVAGSVVSSALTALKPVFTDASKALSSTSPAIFKVRGAGPVNIVAGTGDTIEWEEANGFDIGANFASHTFTAPVAGYYAMDVNLYLLNVDSAATSVNIQIEDGSGYLMHNVFDPSKCLTADGDITCTLSGIVYLAASGTCTVTILITGGANQTDVDADSTWCGHLIG